MEQPWANIFAPGSESLPGYYANCTRTTECAYEGSYSLKMVDQWPQAFFANPTNNPVWAPVAEGTMECYWRYVAPWGYKMIIQMSGKSNYPIYDTNDGFTFETWGGSPGVFTLTYGWNGYNSTANIRSPAVTLVDGKWYRFRIKYRVGGNPSLSLQIDDLPPTTSTNPLGPTECGAWHQILIGNDLLTTGIEYIDNVKIWPVWVADGPTGIAGKMSPGLPATALSAVPNPMRDQIEFTVPAGQTARALTIYDRNGRLVETPWYGVSTAWGRGVSTWDGTHAPAGLYFYSITTDQGIHSGSFTKLE
jgi:hypothetical protein